MTKGTKQERGERAGHKNNWNVWNVTKGVSCLFFCCIVTKQNEMKKKRKKNLILIFFFIFFQFPFDNVYVNVSICVNSFLSHFILRTNVILAYCIWKGFFFSNVKFLWLENRRIKEMNTEKKNIEMIKVVDKKQNMIR